MTMKCSQCKEPCDFSPCRECVRLKVWRQSPAGIRYEARYRRKKYLNRLKRQALRICGPCSCGEHRIKYLRFYGAFKGDVMLRAIRDGAAGETYCVACLEPGLL